MRTGKSFLTAIMISFTFYYSNTAVSQVGIGTNTPNSSAMLDITNSTKGLLIPRMTELQRLNISQPSKSLLVYQTDGAEGFYYNAGTPGLPDWVSLITSAAPAGTVTSVATGTGLTGGPITSTGTISAQNTSALWNANQLQGIGVSSTAPLSGQVLQYNGTNWIPVTSSSIYVLNNSNYLTTTPGDDKIINVQGVVTLSAAYNNLNGNNLFITGGSFDGSGSQTINFGQNCVISGVSFNNIQIAGSSNIQFIDCKFQNITSLPPTCSLTGCQINNSTITNLSTSIGYINNSSISNSSIPRIDRISNSLITNSTLGNASYQIQLMSNNTINSCTINLLGDFTGNNCDETRVLVSVSLTPVIMTGNSFQTSGISNFIEVNLNSSFACAVNISNNNFRGSTSFPSSNHILVYGTYTGTRSITKISNNIAIGGAGSFVSTTYSGNADLMVNDNDLRVVGGGLGVSTGGFIYVRDNLIH